MESAELLAVDSAYDKGLEVLTRLLGLTLSELALETSVAEQSQRVKAFYRQKAAFPSTEEEHILVAQADGKGVPMVRTETVAGKVRRAKGDKKTHKKEAIAIAVYTIAPYPRTPREVVKALFQKGPPTAQRPTPCHKQVFASLDGKEAALQRLAAWVARREGQHIRDRVALTDGSEPLQKHVLAKLPGFTLVLDIIHVDEYLWKAGTAIYGEIALERAEWVEAQMLDILASRAEHVLQRLEDKFRAVRKRAVRPARCFGKWPIICDAISPIWTTPTTCDAAGRLVPVSLKVFVVMWSKTVWNYLACVGRYRVPDHY